MIIQRIIKTSKNIIIMENIIYQNPQKTYGIFYSILTETINELVVDFSFYDKDRSNIIEGIEFEIKK